MKKALFRRQGSLKKQSKLIVDYKPLESCCPDLIPENKTRIVVYVWDYRIQKARKHKLAWFLLQLLNQWLIQEIALNQGVQNNVHG